MITFKNKKKEVLQINTACDTGKSRVISWVFNLTNKKIKNVYKGKLKDTFIRV